MRTVSFLMVLLVALIETQPGHSFCIYNRIGQEILVGVKGIYSGRIPAGGEACCNWRDCGGRRDKEHWLEIFTGTYFSPKAVVHHIISIQAGGCIFVQNDKRDWHWPKGSALAEIIQSISYNIDQNDAGYCTWEVFDSEPYINTGEAARSLNFLVTADTQYWVDKNNVKAIPDQTLATMRNDYLYTTNRGIIIAGDLVERADKSQANYGAYLAALGEEKRFVFDGVGNHDIKEDGWTTIPQLLEEVRLRPRVTLINKRPKSHSLMQPDYSWNWDDVHFVQMNQLPGAPTSGLAWLKQDLATHVGNSGNPVIMIHHYGFDSFSRNWWSDVDRQNYWEVIKNYYVVAIFTGHVHNPEPKVVLEYWQGDSYLNGRKIPYFISGSAKEHVSEKEKRMHGFFLQVTMTRDELTVYRRCGNNGSIAGSGVVTGLKGKDAGRFSKTKSSGFIPFDNIPINGSMLTIYPNPAINDLHIDVLQKFEGTLIEDLEILDSHGNLVKDFVKNITFPASKVAISIRQLPALNFYLIRIKIAGGMMEQRKFWKDIEKNDSFNP